MVKVSVFFVFLDKIECVGMGVRILNLEGHQNCMSSIFIFFLSGISLLWTRGMSVGEDLWLFASVTGGR